MRRFRVIAEVACVVVGVAVLGIPLSAAAQYVTTKTLAVSAFTTSNPDSTDAWIGEAIADMVTTDIAATKRIRVVSRSDLKTILAERKLTNSPMTRDEDRVKLGNMVGARLVLSGTYTIMGDDIRLDAKVYDVESGSSQGGASVQGKKDKLFLLEKKLAMKLFNTLELNVEEEDKIELLQISTRNTNAMRANYKGVLALDDNDTSQAKKYFEEATAADPFYKQARANYDSITVEVKGSALFAGALSDLEAKNRQKSALEGIVQEFIRSYYVFKIQGKPEIITDANKPNQVDIKVNFTVDISQSAVDTFFARMTEISKGDTALEFASEYDPRTFYLHEENWKWFKKNHSHYNGNYLCRADNIGAGYAWFFTNRKLRLMTGSRVGTAVNMTFAIGRFSRMSIKKPGISFCGSSPSGGQEQYNNDLTPAPATLSYTFKGVDISVLNSITELEFTSDD